MNNSPALLTAQNHDDPPGGVSLPRARLSCENQRGGRYPALNGRLLSNPRHDSQKAPSCSIAARRSAVLMGELEPSLSGWNLLKVYH